VSKKSKRSRPGLPFRPSSVSALPPSGIQTAQIQGTIEHFRGPIPPPHILEGYNAAVPGAGERILRMAEEDAAHLRQIERQDQQDTRDNFQRGQTLAVVVCGMAVVLGGWVAWLGHPVSAAAIAGGVPLAQITTAILSQQPWKKRRGSRAQGGNTGPEEGTANKAAKGDG
jgi:uncharacterized membrane protein